MSNKLLKRQNEIFLKKLTHRVEHVRIRPRKQLLRSFVLRVVMICIVWYNLPPLQLTVNDVLIVERFKKINKPLSTTNRGIEPHKQTNLHNFLWRQVLRVLSIRCWLNCVRFLYSLKSNLILWIGKVLFLFVVVRVTALSGPP